MRRAFAEQPGGGALLVTSAGVQVTESLAVCRDVAQYRGDDEWQQMAAGHHARPLEPDAARHAQLVLTATREHRSAIVARLPELRDRLFTLREAVWLGAGYVRAAGASASGSVDAFHSYINGMRGLRPLPAASRGLLRSRREHNQLDIEDGHGGRRSGHHAAIRGSLEAADALAALIVGAT